MRKPGFSYKRCACCGRLWNVSALADSPDRYLCPDCTLRRKRRRKKKRPSPSREDGLFVKSRLQQLNACGAAGGAGLLIPDGRLHFPDVHLT